MDPRTHRKPVLALVTALAFGACGEDAVGPEEFTTDQLTAELAITPDHVHTYENVVTFTVAVTDPNGDAVTDFDVLQVERRITGSGDAFRTMEATLSGDFYQVEHVFEASGEYDIRVTGLRASDTDLVVLHEEASPLHAVRAHAEAGGYRVEFGPDPGHIHEGDTSTIQFWILDETTRDPITGLTPDIFVVESVAGTTTYAAAEGADGLYHAGHTFNEVGPLEIGIEYTGLDAQQHEWTVPVEIHHAH